MNERLAAYQRIVELLDTDDDTTALLNRCISEPRAYYDDNAQLYAERGISSAVDEDTIMWIGMVDILTEKGMLFEFDWSVELGDFIYGMQEINRNEELSIDETGLDEDSHIVEWLTVLNRAWSGQGFVIAGMDIVSDSFCVLIVRESIFHKLAAEADKIGHRIALAQDL
ncbi:MAG: hypothetical protein NC337_12250 [Roseburia sp.]|nr:hypothetical protein [Roseburia sp.]